MPDSHLTVSTRELEARLHGFVREHLRGKSAETVGTYRRSLNPFLRYIRANGGSFSFDGESVAAYRVHLEEEGRSQVTVATYITALRQFCTYLQQIGLIDNNPTDAVKVSARQRRHTRDALTPDEVERLEECFEEDGVLGLRDRAIASCMLYAGLSEIEIVRAQVADLEHTLLGWILRVQGKGRSEKDERVPLDEPAIDAVQAYLTARSKLSPEQPLFASHGRRSAGRPLNTRSVRSRVNRLLESAGLKRPGVTPHSLTHTAPMLWLRRGMTLEEVRQRMRHGTLETTKLYQELAAEAE